MTKLQTISPVDGSVYFTTIRHSTTEINSSIQTAKTALPIWSELDLSERCRLINALVKIIESETTAIANEISWQMGRPISQTPFEVNGFVERANTMLKLAKSALTAHYPQPIDDYKRWIEREPLGIVAVLSPWNYPLLTSVNAIVPALIAGNVVILKHSEQTPLVAQRYLEAAKKANLPDGVLQILNLDHKSTAQLIADQDINGVFFTGSVEGGKAIQKSLQNKFITCGLELGGKDPAYVMADANVANSVANLVDGAFFNSGQSCCGIERIYVHANIYDEFIEQFVTSTKQYKLGNPFDNKVNLGPMVKTAAADYVRQQISQAIALGAKSLVDETLFPASKSGTPYLSPHVLTEVNHNMQLMTEESFGPVVGIMKVNNDAEALTLINDSKYGLTASLWGQVTKTTIALSKKIQAGTVFINRCDYLDPALAWTGIKNSGHGITLSTLGYEQVTQAKSYHFKLTQN